MPIKIFYTIKDHRAMPEHKSQLAAGWDLKYCGDNEIEIKPGTRALIPTGFCIAMDRLTFGKIEGRSGLALKNGIIILGGVIDSDYRGEIGVILYNSDPQTSFFVRPFERIAQLIFHQVNPLSVELLSVEDLPASERGSFGFGSTGVN